MLKDMDCQRVPVEGNGHGDGGSFLHRLVMRLYGGGGEQAQDAQDVLQEAVLPTEHLSAPSTEQAQAAPQKKAGHSVNTPTNSLLYALWSEWNDIQVGVNAFDYVLNLPLEDGRNGRQLLNDEESKTALHTHVDDTFIRLGKGLLQKFLSKAPQGILSSFPGSYEQNAAFADPLPHSLYLLT